MSDRAVLKECAKIQEIDDALGKRSDHEGDENGPTWYLWNQDPRDFELIAQEQINNHHRAVYHWTKLRSMNRRRIRG
jgi:hypothetical protein